MILCPSCSAKSSHVRDGCPQCGFKPARIDGFLSWAPELARNNDGFPGESFEGLARVESGNFWFRTRNALILWALHKYFPDFQSLLEVGCGTGFVLSGVSQEFPLARIVGSEIYTTGLAFAAKRLPGVELLQMDARKLPYYAEFDLLTAFDVIEHILEDELVLDNIFRAIKPGGGCLITVPQHKWLWSPMDDAACHQRRYSARELHSKLEAAGFRIVRSTSFVTLLLPLMVVSRQVARLSGKAGGSESLAINPALDRVLDAVMRMEQLLIRWGVNFSFGGSRLVVAQKDL